MKAMILAGVLMLGAAPLVAAHAEGNGPAFPGLQDPNVGITTLGAGQGTATETMDHSANDYATGNAGWNAVPKAPAGLTHAQLVRRAHTWQMINDNSGTAG